MNDSPSIRLATKHHRHPQVEGRWFSPTRNTEPNVLGLDKISELGPDRRPNFLSAACTSENCELAQSSRDATLSHPDSTPPKAPQMLTSSLWDQSALNAGGTSLRKFKFCGLKFCDEC